MNPGMLLICMSEKIQPVNLNSEASPVFEEAPPPEPPPLPSVAFADHVARVREEGDAVANSPNVQVFSRREAGVVAASTALGVVGSVLSPLCLASGLGICVRGAYKYFRATEEYASEAGRLLDNTSQKALGQHYEIYGDKRGKKPLALRWYGPIETQVESQEAVLAQLAAIAALARENDIEQFAVGKDVLEGLRLPCEMAEAETLTVRKFFRKRGMRLDMRQGKEEILVASPAVWQQQAELLKSSLCNPKVEDFVRVLESFMPEHPLVRTFKEYEKYPAELRKRLARVSDTSLKNQLCEPVGVSNRSLINAPVLSEEGTITKKRKVVSQAYETDNGTRVIWQAEGRTIDEEPILAALGIQPEEVKSLLAAPETQPTKARKLLELLIYNAVRGKHNFAARISLPGQKDESFEFPKIPMAQEVLTGVVRAKKGEALSIRGDDSPRLTMSMLFIAAVAATLAFKGSQIIGLDEKIKEQAGLTRDYFMGPPPPSTGGRAGSEFGRQEGGMGKPAEAAFILQDKGLPLDGYWTQEVADIVATDYDGRQKTLGWTSYDQGRSSPLPKDYSGMAPHIEVGRDIKSYDWEHFDNIVRVPVKNGTKPVAARYGDDPVELVTFEGGVYGFKMPDKSEKRLTYWLEATSGQPHAFAPVSATPVSWLSLDWLGTEKYWEDRFPVSPDPQNRAQEMASYIARNYAYELNPPPEAVFPSEGGKGEWSEMVAVIDRQRRVQCLIANSQNVVSNPSWLNLAGGFRNNGDTILTNREAHAWGVDYVGAVVDATPPTSDPELIKYFSEVPGTFKGQEFPSIPLSIVAGAALTGLAYWRRRQISSAYYKWFDGPGKKLQRYTPDQVSATARITEALLYSSAEIDDEIKIRNAVVRLRQDMPVVTEAAEAVRRLQMLPKPSDLKKRLGAVRDAYPEVTVARAMLGLITKGQRRQAALAKLQSKKRSRSPGKA